MGAIRRAVITRTARSQIPPFQAQALLRAEATDRERLLAFLKLCQGLIPAPEWVEIYDPIDAIPAKLANRFRMHLLVQSDYRPALRQFLAEWWPAIEATASSSICWTLDIDPVEL